MYNPNEKIEPINVADEVSRSFLDYSMSVIISRALPDARDGLKPVQRRILYAMLREGLLHNRSYTKCAGVVGEVLKNYPKAVLLSREQYEKLLREAAPKDASLNPPPRAAALVAAKYNGRVEGNVLTAKLFHPQGEQLAKLMETCVEQAWAKVNAPGRTAELQPPGLDAALDGSAPPMNALDGAARGEKR